MPREESGEGWGGVPLCGTRLQLRGRHNLPECLSHLNRAVYLPHSHLVALAHPARRHDASLRVSVSMKLLVSEMELMESAGISLSSSATNWYTWATLRLVT